jgi:C-terminal processing protease CtpA/Prc
MSVEMKDHLVTVISTFKGSPADQAGIRPGDIITTVNGETVQGLSIDQVVAKIKGTEGSTVQVELYRPPVSETTTTTTALDRSQTTTTTEAGTADVSHLPPGGQSKEYSLTRRNIEIPVTERKIVEAGDKKVAVINFYTFSQGSAAALRAAVKQAVEVLMRASAALGCEARRLVQHQGMRVAMDHQFADERGLVVAQRRSLALRTRGLLRDGLGRRQADLLAGLDAISRPDALAV